MLLADLAPEIIITISHHLSTHEALTLAATSHSFYNILDDLIFTRHVRTEAHPYIPLWWACGQDTPAALRVAERALSLGVGVDSLPRGRGALATAVETESINMIALLLRYGADPCLPVTSASPMSMAIEKGNLEVIKTLLSVADERYDPGIGISKSEVSRRLHGRCGSNMYTCLHWSIVALRFEQIPLLLDHGANVNSRSFHDITPFSEAVQHGNMDLVRLLLDAGADPLALDHDGRDSLDACVFNAHRKAESSWEKDMMGHRDVLRYLLTLRSAGGGRGSSEQTRLRRTWRYVSEDRMHKMLAYSEPSSLVTIRILVEFGIVVDARDALYGRTALIHHAGRKSRRDGTADPAAVEVVQALLDAGANVNARDKFMMDTALITAAQSKNIAVFRLLLESGADANLRNGSGLAAIEICEQAGSLDMVELFHKHEKMKA